MQQVEDGWWGEVFIRDRVPPETYTYNPFCNPQTQNPYLFDTSLLQEQGVDWGSIEERKGERERRGGDYKDNHVLMYMYSKETQVLM